MTTFHIIIKTKQKTISDLMIPFKMKFLFRTKMAILCHNSVVAFFEMGRLNFKFKLTFIFSTHDQRLIDQVRTVLYVKDGQISESRNHHV
jgi:hypothetical protein